MSKRDTQKGRVYAADNKAFAEFKFRDVSTPEKSQARVDDVWSSKWLRVNYPRAARFDQPQVTFINRMKGARANGREIDIGGNDFARSEWVLMHELAHSINHRTNDNATGHGWQYCSIYLGLVSRFLSTAAADALKAQFKAHRVRYNAPRARAPMSDEQRAALVARLAAVRKPRVARTLWQRAFDSGKVRGYITHALSYGSWLRLYIGTKDDTQYIVVERLSGRPSCPYHHGTRRVESAAELDVTVSEAMGRLW